MPEQERNAISNQPSVPTETLYVLEMLGPNGFFFFPFYATNETKKEVAQQAAQQFYGCQLRQVRKEPYGFHLKDHFFPAIRQVTSEPPRKGRRRKEYPPQ